MYETEVNVIGQVQPTVVVIEKTSRKKPIEDCYETKHARKVGEVHIFCAAIALIAGVFLVLNHDRRKGFGSAGTGIWSSVFFFITGVLSIFSAKRGNSCQVVSILVMGIISALSAFTLIIFSFSALGNDSCSYTSYNYKIITNCEDKVRVGLNILQISVGVIEMVLAIISSSISCKAACCRDKLDTCTHSNRTRSRPWS